MPERSASSFRERAERLFASARGDSLGLGQDPEVRLQLAEVAAERYAKSLDSALLRDWEELVAELEQSDSAAWSPELRRQVRMHRVMLDGWKNLVERSQPKPRRPPSSHSYHRKGNRLATFRVIKSTGMTSGKVTASASKKRRAQ